MIIRLTEQGAGSPMISWLIMMAFILGVYFIVMRPQRREQKNMAARLAALEIGDSVRTSSGFIGVVIDIDAESNTVIVEFGNNKNTRIPMLREAIVEIEKPEDAVKPAEQVAEEGGKKKGLFGSRK